MTSETRTCQNCKQPFMIETDDFSFYEKNKVPPPTWCPACRLRRRLAWMVGLVLFKRQCDLCKKEYISMYRSDAPLVAYCPKCWWSDAWDPMEYGQEYDFGKPFFAQWKELFGRVPLLGLSLDAFSGDLSPYTNHCGHCKSCYMVFYSDYNETCLYGYYLARNKDLLNCSIAMQSERCYDNSHLFKSYQVVGSRGNVADSLDCAFLRDCDNCQHCFGSANLRNRSYVFFNEQLTKEEYQRRMAEIDLGSYTTYEQYAKKAAEAWKRFPPYPAYNEFSRDSTGSYVFESKNCKECYDVVGAEDSKFLMLMKTAPVRDSYDYTDWGNNAARIYECMTVGENAADVRFSHESGINCSNLDYTKLLVDTHYAFGCIGVRKRRFCILNKQYSEDEYERLIPRIKRHMDDMPHVDTAGRTYRYGEFFPMEFSPHAYNETFAQFFFPQSEEQIHAEGLLWRNVQPKEYAVTRKAEELPDHIKETTDRILNEVIACKTCGRGYRVTPQELLLAKQMNVPLSRECPFCRIGAHVKEWVRQMRHFPRVCDACGAQFETHHTPEDAPHMLCKRCYLAEFV